MKKIKTVALGDKVFAKVKGYPAWPARVEEDLGKKYKVFFYGTGETGLVKAEDLFSYVEHKDQFTRSLKRKDYNDAIEEIEAAIAQDQRKTGDANDTKEPVEKLEPEVKEEEDSPKVGVKRKLSTDSSSDSSKKRATSSRPVVLLTNTKQTAKDGKPTTDESEKNESNEKNDSAESAEDRKSPESIFSNEDEEESETREDDGKSATNNKDASVPRTSRNSLLNDTLSSWEEDLENNDSFSMKSSEENTKFKVVTPIALQDLIEEFENCEKDSDKANEKPAETNEAQNEVLLARLTPTKYVGIKLNRNRPDAALESELERLRWKQLDARAALELKAQVEGGLVRFEDKPELFETDLELSDEQLRDALKNRLLERKRSKLKYLKVELALVELDSTIKTNLALDKANPKDALKDMDVMLQLNVEALMLKKHSHVMEMVKRLRRYIGNVKEWKFEGNELEEFQKDAGKIREKAEVVYNRFKSLFTVPDNKSFWEVFNEECEKFRSLTKDLTENQTFMLCAEPGTKQAIWDKLDDEEELKTNAMRKNDNLIDKENEKEEKVPEIMDTTEPIVTSRD